MRRVFLLFVAAALVGCPPKVQYPECKLDTDCADHGQVCIAGFCKECREDKDCASAHPDRPVCRDALCSLAPVVAPPTPPPQDECLADADCGDGKACVDKKCKEQGGVLNSSASQKLGDCEVNAVYFGFDDATLSPETRKELDADWECLQKSSYRRALLSGHTDERGTTEYNLALGERRAEAVKKYLTGLGADGRRLKAISYGKERAADAGHDEAAWARNRRVEIVTEQ
jgi:peptidoglycan-associated lipoprotein